MAITSLFKAERYF